LMPLKADVISGVAATNVLVLRTRHARNRQEAIYV
jgi:hypothetical protein